MEPVVIACIVFGVLFVVLLVWYRYAVATSG
jgi:hypothetical protein